MFLEETGDSSQETDKNIKKRGLFCLSYNIRYQASLPDT
ncbi:hypothetical protein L21TH_1805 [Caldisalinibacter kiritimatiensis]|uniref:Uncharacterized protein n=1 Tax=Caldisalinibacter kiritimatiensis TaxID=1304284 RepID=R1CTY9_9FIRM|nr:hypothetical protein L21TH_1805 [Caldisalinibacter kiritimatiensis]